MIKINQSTFEYNGKKYRASKTNKKYYYSDYRENGKRKKAALHRQVFIDNFGSIPEGFDIHHKDENTENNEYWNLEAVNAGDHRSEHQKKRMQDPDYRKRKIEYLVNNVDKARLWHSSSEGKKWHKEHGIRSWELRTKITKECKLCKEKFDTFRPDANFCSNSCWQKNRYKEKAGFEKRVCIQCGREFDVRKNEKNKSCSRKCAGLFKTGKKKKKYLT